MVTKRINIVLPADTVKTIDRLTKPGERSRFIDRAVLHFAATQSQEALRKRLEMTAVRDRDLDQEVATDWFALDEQAWQQLDPNPTSSKSQGSPGAAKSTSRRSTRR